MEMRPAMVRKGIIRCKTHLYKLSDSGILTVFSSKHLVLSGILVLFGPGNPDRQQFSAFGKMPFTQKSAFLALIIRLFWQCCEIRQFCTPGYRKISDIFW